MQLRNDISVEFRVAQTLIFIDDGSEEEVFVESEKQNHADIVYEDAFPLDGNFADRVCERRNGKYEQQYEDVDPRLDLQHKVVVSALVSGARGVFQNI